MTFEIAVIIASLSGCALLVSIITLYWNSFRVLHKLSAVVSYHRPRGSSKTVSDFSSNFEIEVILANSGNRSEAVLRLMMYYENKNGVFGSGGPAPFVLEDGGVVVHKLSMPMHTILANQQASGGHVSPFGISTRIVERSGAIIERRMPVGTIFAVQATPQQSGHLRVTFDGDASAIQLLTENTSGRLRRAAAWFVGLGAER